ncbi:MAG: hypothetical protein R3F45_10440 [Gammaproteobacteria bacterium]
MKKPSATPAEAHVLAPALFEPASPERSYHEALRAAPALRLILTRGREQRRAASVQFHYALFGLFGIAAGGDGDLPVAAATALFDLPGLSGGGAWLRADPVHLRPDLGRLLLFDAATFELSMAEATRLTEEINAALAEEGFRLRVGRDPGRWYLPMASAPAIQTVPPRPVRGQHVDPFLPRGAGAQRWRRLANDVQMVLHSSPVNAAREGRGEPAVNSVWFWGGGVLPRSDAAWTAVVTDVPVAAGLAMAAGLPLVEAPPPHPPATGRWLYVPAAGARDGTMQALDSSLLAPLLAALRRGSLAAITVHLPRASYTLRRGDLWRFWRRLPRTAPTA